MSDDNLPNPSAASILSDRIDDLILSPPANRFWISLGLKIGIMIGGLGVALWLGLLWSQFDWAEQTRRDPLPTFSHQVETKHQQKDEEALHSRRLAKQLDLNHSTVEELQQLPGIGPVLAARIVERREHKGPFRRVEDLLGVKGIGQGRLARLATRVTVSSPTP